MESKNKKKKPEKEYYRIDKEELVFRDHLAADRTALANERTLLSYIRTAIAFAAGGAGLIKFTPTTGLIALGWILISTGIIFLGLGLFRFLQFRRKISKLGCDYFVDDKPKVKKNEESKIETT